MLFRYNFKVNIIRPDPLVSQSDITMRFLNFNIKAGRAYAVAIICIAVSLSNFVTAQGRFDEVQIIKNQLTDDIYMLEGSGGNIGIFLGEKDVFMIDDQYAPLSEKILTAIRSLSDKNIKYLANTHWHGDHTGGNENFAAEGAIILAHENVYQRMSTEQVRGDRVTTASPAAALPQIVFSDEMEVFLDGQNAKLIHVGNAHTDGDIFIWFPSSNVLHMGDCFFHQRFPYIDLDSGGSVNGAIKAVEVALMLVDDNTQIIPGHGSVGNRADLEKYLEFLTTIRDRINEYVSVGRGIESMKAEDIVKGYEDWSWGFIDAARLTSIFYNSLSGGQ